VDTIRPKIVSITPNVDLNNPLVIEFNEEIRIANGDHSLYVTPDGTTTRIRMYTVKKCETNNRAITAEIRSNELKENTNYTASTALLNQDEYYIAVRDLGRNSYIEKVSDVNEALVSFTTGDVSGPVIQSTKVPVYGVDRYIAVIEDGKLKITIHEDIHPGPFFEEIVLSYGQSLALWNAEVHRSRIKKSGIPRNLSIEGNTLIIAPLAAAPFDVGLSYAAYIPEKALVDSAGNTINDIERIWANWSDGPYLIVYAASTLETLKPEIKFITSPLDVSITGMLHAMIKSFEQRVGMGEHVTVEQGKYLMAVFQTTVSPTGGGFNVQGVSVQKLDGEDNVVGTAPVVIASIYEHSEFGSNTMLILLEENLEIGSDYKLLLPQGAVRQSVGVLTNDAQEIKFTVGAAESEFSGSGDLDLQSLIGRVRAGEVLWVQSKYQKYADMVGGSLSYQWYRGDTEDSSLAEEISGENSIRYIPTEEDVGKYLFLKLTLERKSDLNPDATETAEYMSPGLGPVERAFIRDSSITSISVAGNGTEYLGSTRFNSNQDQYDINVSIDVRSVTVDVDFDPDLNSVVMINGIPISEQWVTEDGFIEPEPGIDIELGPGVNPVVVQSIAEDFRSDSVYIINITRDPGDTDNADNVKPEARVVEIVNKYDYFTGRTLTGTYEYFDELGREESGTTYQWWRQNDYEGEGDRQPIAGAVGLTYTLTDDDIDKYIYFTVTPKSEGSTEGETEESWWVGPVKRVDEQATSITDISVTYKGKELLGNFDPQQKTYTLKFKHEDDSNTVTVTANGNNVTINGDSGSSADVNFAENYLIEVGDDSGGSPYYLIISVTPFAAGIDIVGEDSIVLSHEDGEGSVQGAYLYDQYGEPLNRPVEWVVPDGINYTVDGFYDELLIMHIPSTVPSGAVTITASARDNETVTLDKELTIQNEVPLVYTVTFRDWNGTELKTERVNDGEAATAPASPTREGYTFTGWDVEFNNVTSDLTVTAQYNDDSGSSGGGGTSTPTPSPAPEEPLVEEPVIEKTTEDNTVTTTTVTTTIDDSGTAEAIVTQEQVSEAVSKALEEAEKEGNGIVAVVEIKVEAPTFANAIEANLPKTAVDTVSSSNLTALTISTPIAAITFDAKALDAISAQAASDVKISAAKVELEKLSEEVKMLVGDRSVYNFSVTSGDRNISQFGGNVSVALPYTPKPGEDNDAIVIYYFNPEGNLEIVSNCKYDPATGFISFTTNHFSNTRAEVAQVMYNLLSK
jgi:hypothetical protein